MTDGVTMVTEVADGASYPDKGNKLLTGVVVGAAEQDQSSDSHINGKTVTTI